MLAVEMIWQGPENEALGIAVITQPQDSCNMSCANSEGVCKRTEMGCVEGGGGVHCPFQQSMCTFTKKTHKNTKQRNANPSYLKSPASQTEITSSV